MQRHGFEHVTAEFIQGFRLRKDTATKRACVKAALLGIANLEDQLQDTRIQEHRGREAGARLRCDSGQSILGFLVNVVVSGRIPDESRDYNSLTGEL